MNIFVNNVLTAALQSMPKNLFLLIPMTLKLYGEQVHGMLSVCYIWW